VGDLRVAYETLDARILVTDSLTYCDERVTTHDVVVAGSFAGVLAFALAYERGVRALIAHAAGVGKDAAGVSGLADADRRGLPAAAVETMSARIGDGESVWSDGVIGHANDRARARGVTIGMPAAAAARRLLAAAPGTVVRGLVSRAPTVALEAAAGRVVLMGSTSFVTRANEADVICAGSHGGRVNALPLLATPPRGAIVYDGGMARDQSGIGGLALLDDSGIAAAAVASASARIGDTRSAWETGVLSAVNRTAARAGVAVGMTVRDAATRMLAARAPSR